MSCSRLPRNGASPTCRRAPPISLLLSLLLLPQDSVAEQNHPPRASAGQEKTKGMRLEKDMEECAMCACVQTTSDSFNDKS